jgi:response regulator RpfG family c-di-GMP phosphodiesterase
MHLQHVVLVDDDEISNFIYRKLLKLIAPDALVEEFLTADSALASFKSTGKLPQLLLLDVNLAGMSSWDFLHHVESSFGLQASQTIVYIISASLDERDIMKAYQSNRVSGFLSKPVAFEKLKAVCAPFSEVGH